MKSIYSEKPPLLERPANILPSFDQNDKRTLAQELQMSSIQKDFCFDELESIVKIKQAEAKMFQSRADDARREAEGLKRIALAKNEKIEEEYTNRIAKLRLTETDEIRKQKFEELQALERAHLEYLNMKMRMEADIKDLLSKMEATKMSLAM
ncbi:OBERON 4 [Spatholobus suberectus]|nr:OBERON 4 [Spatholobus suberectus]